MMKREEFKGLEVFDAPFAVGSENLIHITVPEFTCLCPKTGQPDFGKIELHYLPRRHCVELKSLKLYMWTFRDKGAFHEAVTNEIADTIGVAISPLWMQLTARFFVRGGIYTTVTAVRGDSEFRERHFKILPDTSRDGSENYV
jgi:7-cyano-7-deazaguanine reductase